MFEFLVPSPEPTASCRLLFLRFSIDQDTGFSSRCSRGRQGRRDALLDQLRFASTFANYRSYYPDMLASLRKKRYQRVFELVQNSKVVPDWTMEFALQLE